MMRYREEETDKQQPYIDALLGDAGVEAREKAKADQKRLNELEKMFADGPK